jgi:hypothetical protein
MGLHIQARPGKVPRMALSGESIVIQRKAIDERD